MQVCIDQNVRGTKPSRTATTISCDALKMQTGLMTVQVRVLCVTHEHDTQPQRLAGTQSLDWDLDDCQPAKKNSDCLI
jgi:hypothetical protein